MRRILVLVLVLGMAGSGIAGTLAPAKPSDLVTVFGNTTAGCPTLFGAFAVTSQQVSDGSPTAFSIPAGQVLVITSWDWKSSGGGAAAAATWATLYTVTPSGGARISDGNGTSDGSGSAAGTTIIPSGFAMKSGENLCFTTGGSGVGYVLVHGFLTKDK
jgi:hypothetical protein